MMQEFVQAIEDTVSSILNEIHTSMPGSIQFYDEKTGFVDVKPIGVYKAGNGELYDYPIISNVPLHVTGSSGINIATPIRKGDECLLIFAEQSLDTWLSGNPEDDTDLRFDLSNAIAIPGLTKVAVTAQNEANKRGCVVVTGNLYVDGNITCSGRIERTENE